ncbi:MAG: TIGR04086 family membrane protein [Clostridiales bacterium]|nr:TIGR04086 family membrane protein [Clostridiales bacterium]
MPKSKRKRRERTESDGRTLLINTAVSVCVGLAVFFAIIVVISAITVKADSPSDKLPVFAYAAVGVGALACGFTASKKQRKRGALNGLVCSIPFVTIVLITALIAASGEPETAIIYNIPIALAASTAGGVLGVNV